MVVDSSPFRPASIEAPRRIPSALHQRALALWPRLDQRVLSRCGSDVRRIARYISRRTNLSVEAIQAILERGDTPDDDDIRLWFG